MSPPASSSDAALFAAILAAPSEVCDSGGEGIVPISVVKRRRCKVEPSSVRLGSDTVLGWVRGFNEKRTSRAHEGARNQMVCFGAASSHPLTTRTWRPARFPDLGPLLCSRRGLRRAGEKCDETGRPRATTMLFQCPSNWQAKPATQIVSIHEGARDRGGGLRGCVIARCSRRQTSASHFHAEPLCSLLRIT